MFITLTELRYIVALAREKHFGRAAIKCFVSQPSLSIAIKKLEDNLGVQLFERNKNQVIVTDAGMAIVAKAQQVLDSVTEIQEFAKQNNKELPTELKLGAIHTVGPYLFPDLITHINQQGYPLKLLIEEGMTATLNEKLQNGELDAIIVATPYERPNIISEELYSEDLRVIMAADHPWKDKKSINPKDLQEQTVLILGTGHCFRDYILQICPSCSFSQDNNHTIITSSIETIKYMVAGNIGISIVPKRSLREINNQVIVSKDFITPIPQRHIVLAYRKNFGRLEAVKQLIKLIRTISQPQDSLKLSLA